MAEGNDLGRIVSLIMENPKLIEEISNLGKKNDTQRETAEQTESAEPTQSTVQSSERKSTEQKKAGNRNRSQLLGALKPYVSTERAQAIDSMLTIVEILDAMKGRS